VTQALNRVRQAARTRKKERFTALLHHVGIDLLRDAFFALKRDAAPGADGLKWWDDEADLEPRLAALHDRVQRGAYRPQPSRRTYIPKADGKQRPPAIAALEDKIVQGATAMVLNAIHEEDFLGFSYGFRRGRGPHDALDALDVGINSRKVSYILDADIRSSSTRLTKNGSFVSWNIESATRPSSASPNVAQGGHPQAHPFFYGRISRIRASRSTSTSIVAVAWCGGRARPNCSKGELMGTSTPYGSW